MRLLLCMFVALVACGAPERPVAPSNVHVKATGKGTVAIALVMNGWEQWIGNDKEIPEITEDDPSRYPGVLIELRSALDNHQLSTTGAPGSLGMVITYADRPVIRVPMGPLKQVTGSALGTQRDYFNKIGVETVSAIQLALAELAKVEAARKVLIVISDGNDTNNDEARSQLPKLKAQAEQAEIQTFAIIYKAKLSGEQNVVSLMIPDTKQINEAKEIDAAIAAIVARINP